MLPALFIGHGSPMNALGNGAYAKYLGELGRDLPRPRGILMVSAHWLTLQSEVLDVPVPATIHDFFGFPSELYQIQYPAPIATRVVSRVTELLGPSVVRSKSWGFDHGTWAVLRFMYPEANIPVSQLSLNKNLSLREHYEIGVRLRALRQEGVLVVGSGNIVHNLRDLSWDSQASPFPWAVEFDRVIAKALKHRNLDTLLEFKDIDVEVVRRAVPSTEHFAPLVYALGVSEAGDGVTFPFTAIQNGSVAMRAVRFG
jgi:4,5-DOPA dioxygenase extradiol